MIDVTFRIYSYQYLIYFDIKTALGVFYYYYYYCYYENERGEIVESNLNFKCVQKNRKASYFELHNCVLTN